MRHAFTLTEIALSLLILIIAVLATMAILPLGLKAQQQSRYQMYASAKAQEIIDAFVQHQIDFKDRQDLAFRDLFHDHGELKSNQPHQAFANRPLLAAPGQFDLERIVTNLQGGNYAVPIAIARRFDSSNGEIQRILDAGGHIYYSDPLSLGRHSVEVVGQGGARGADHGLNPEVQRLVFAIVGNAQNNALPMHPIMMPIREIYPFPPRTRTDTVPSTYSRMRQKEATKKGVPYTKDGYPRQVQDYDFKDRPGVADAAARNESGPIAFYQQNNWEWFAYGDSQRGRDSTSSKWIAGLHEFRRLSTAHWLRIAHQLDVHGGVPVVTKPRPWITKKTINGNEYDVDADGNIVLDKPPGDPVLRGIPGLPLGLGTSRLRGTDILYEDAEPWGKQRDDQFRWGLPSLERRVMYRTAALALWARVAPGGPYQIMNIPAADLTRESTATIDADPNIAGKLSLLPAALNPLFGIMEPPNPVDLHPTQILALSYLAHAAMMVTGYKPPFIDDKRTIEASDDLNLVKDETMPFKAVHAEFEHYLLNPFWPDAHKFRDTELDPLATGEVDPTEPRAKVPPAADTPIDQQAADQGNPRFQRRFDGKPIKYRRMVGDILNPFPPPYADRGAFAMDGSATFTITESPGPDVTFDKIPRRTILRRVTAYSGPSGQDGLWARNAHETCLRWAMAYTSENPHDYVVPKPLNRQAMMDAGLYQLAFFDQVGGARRKPSDVDSFGITFASDRARFGAAFVPPELVDHAGRYGTLQVTRGGEAKTLPPVERGLPFEWGAAAPHRSAAPLWVDDQRDGNGFLKTSFGRQERFQAVLNAMHRHAESVPGAGGWDPQMGVADLAGAGSPVRGQCTMYRPFDVAERTRQLVFWAVDWKQYEDAESAPSAPFDLESSDYGVVLPRSGLVGNPERLFTWMNPLRDGTFRHPPPLSVRSTPDGTTSYDKRFPFIWYGSPEDYVKMPWGQCGVWGADRNGNGVFDRGPVPRTVRMKANEVARFNFYDPVGWLNFSH